MEAFIQNDAKLLYIIDPVYFTMMEMSAAEGQFEGPAFAGMSGQEEQGEKKEQESYQDYGEQGHWGDIHRRRINRDVSPAIEIQCLEWDNW